MKKALFFLFVMLLGACSNDPDFSGNPIGSNILVEIREDQPSKPYLYCRTELEYNNVCLLTTEKNFRANALKIDFTGRSTDGAFAAVVGPASAVIDLSTIAGGTYMIELNNGNLKNKGTLIIGDEKVTLQISNTNGIKIVTPVFKRGT